MSRKLLKTGEIWIVLWQVGRMVLISESNYGVPGNELDEFKITKYPGGNEQNPPDIDGQTIGKPGVEYDYTFVANDPEGDDESKKKGKCTQGSKKMHGFFNKTHDKSNGNKIKKSINESFKSKFTPSVFSRVMCNYLFTDPVETIPLGYDWNIAMHFSIYTNTMNNFRTVSFQPAIEIVQLYS